jgi:hypothetical protein
MARKRRKKNKGELVILQEKIWEECKRIIRNRYGKICYACGKKIVKSSDWHTAHFIPKSVCKPYLKYDLRNLRPCCYKCNVILSGNWSFFFQKLRREKGMTVINKLLKDRDKEVENVKEFYKKIYEEYKQM